MIKFRQGINSKILVTLILFIRHLINEAMNGGGGGGGFFGGVGGVWGG